MVLRVGVPLTTPHLHYSSFLLLLILESCTSPDYCPSTQLCKLSLLSNLPLNMQQFPKAPMALFFAYMKRL